MMAANQTNSKRARKYHDDDDVMITGESSAPITGEKVDLSGISDAQLLQIAKNVVNHLATKRWLATGPAGSLPGLSAVRNYAAGAETEQEQENPLTGAPASYTAERKEKAEQMLLTAAKGDNPE